MIKSGLRGLDRIEILPLLYPLLESSPLDFLLPSLREAPLSSFDDDTVVLSLSVRNMTPNTPRSQTKPTVVGIYGLPGCGKSFLLNELKSTLGEQHFSFFEGSAIIASLVPGSLESFSGLCEDDKRMYRQAAIEFIHNECNIDGKTGIVAGHYMFWPEEEDLPTKVVTNQDLNVYTHIVYLDVAPEIMSSRREMDETRSRPSASIDHLRKWQATEKTELADLCRSYNILFTSLPSSDNTVLERVEALVVDFQRHTPEYNLARAESTLDEIIGAINMAKTLETILILDADKTLAPQDTGNLFWEKLAKDGHQATHDAGRNPLKVLFSGPLGYSHNAFRQAVLLYEQAADDIEFEVLCSQVAASVKMYPEMVSLLRMVQKEKHIAAVVLTCGLRSVWEQVLEQAGLAESVKVIGGGRVSDDLVITGEVKATLVSRLRDHHGLYVWAIGDGVLDVPMMNQANSAVVVVGPEETRGKSMDTALKTAIEHDGLLASQALFPRTVPPRLDPAIAPLMDIADPWFTASILRRRGPNTRQQRIHYATDRDAARLLMTPTRDATVAGPALREAHRRIGWYLATEFLTTEVGLEEYSIPHVQGHNTNGHRLRAEAKTCIIALMRGGEPLAFGVNDAFPLAMFVHAKEVADVKPHHMNGKHTILLVDSVINSGKSAIEFVRHVRTLHEKSAIVIVAGVVQTQAVGAESELGGMIDEDVDLSLVALRMSENKFTGRKGTDTGNRLFNTTHLE